MAPVKLRGGLGVDNQLAVTFGIFLSMVLGLQEALGGPDLWPVLLAMIAVPSVIQVPYNSHVGIERCQDC